MLALKHGAAHIRAFEIDNDRYQLGCEIIDRLKLSSCVELINERYDRNCSTTPVTFTETVNGNLWWEGLWNSLPSHTSPGVFLPGQYFLEIWAVEIPEVFAQRLGQLDQSQQFFAPGVEVDPEFVSVVNNLMNKSSTQTQPLTPGIVTFERQQETIWGWVPYLRAVAAGTCVASYSARTWAPDTDSIELNIATATWHDKTVLIVPRMGMQQDLDKLYLDTGHWGPGENPVILVKPQHNLVVEHSVRNGIITYSLET
jgi:hypothetical protein